MIVLLFFSFFFLVSLLMLIQLCIVMQHVQQVQITNKRPSKRKKNGEERKFPDNTASGLPVRSTKIVIRLSRSNKTKESLV